MKINIEGTKIFQRNYNEYLKKKNRVILNIGGSGSSKSYSIAQLFGIIMLNEEDTQITIARKTLPSLRATAMKDFFNILRKWDVYEEKAHNKSENIYRYKSNIIDFLSVDEPIKIRSRRRQYLWLNEANEFQKDDFMQLSMRTDKQIFMDFNPSHQYHWIYDDIELKENSIVIHSTYKDNPFLPESIIKEIKGYKKTDKNYWRIYGLGLKSVTEATIYTHWQLCDKLPDNPEKVFYGLDYGYNNQTALIKIVIKDQEYYWEEVLYERRLTNQDLIKKLEELKIPKDIPIYPDIEPARNEEIKRAGFYIITSYKGEVKNGINKIKSHKFHITKSSVNLLKEIKSYCWREKDGRRLEEPVKIDDHLLDAGRMAIVTDDHEINVKLTWL